MSYNKSKAQSYHGRSTSTKSPIKSFVFLVVAIVVLALIWNIINFFNGLNDSPSNSPKEYSITVESGDNLAKVGDKLQKQNIINSPLALQYLAQTKEKWTLLPGKYNLELPAKPEQIMEQIKTQSEFYARIPKGQKQYVNVTFKEGDTADVIIQKLVKANIASEADLKTTMNNESFKSKFAFLPKKLDCKYGNMQNCAKYYLEGYLYPDTYNFYVNAGAEEALTKLLRNFETKVWAKVKTQVGTKDFGQAVIMASVIEKETGRPIEGVNDDNIDTLNKEKKTIAGVFYNRIDTNMKWGSDPTVSYGTGKNLCQQTLKTQTDCLYLDSPESSNKYNTYENFGYPIAPITTPTIGSIEAALNPQETDYLFFVSDASGKKYFSDSGNGHDQNIKNVQSINEQYRN
jgi:UPF0755 protein